MTIEQNSSILDPPVQTAGHNFLHLHPFVRMTVHSKIVGTLLGSALGDCIGLYTEFISKSIARDAYPDGRFRLVDPVTEFRSDGHRDKFEAGFWTDDTDHALLLLLSYLHSDGKGVSAQDVAERLRSWVVQGLRVLDRLPLGLGQTVGRVVYDEEFLADPAAVAYKHWEKSGRKVAPNGSLMRTHPLGPICLGKSLEETFNIAAEHSLITHADPRCVVACCIVTGLIRGVLRGEILGEQAMDNLIEYAYEWVNARVKNGRMDENSKEKTERLYGDGDLLDGDEFSKMVHAKSFDELGLDERQSIGYVYKCLGAAVLSLRMGMRRAPCARFDLTPATESIGTGPEAEDLELYHPEVFEDIITALTYEAGDADTNACVAGALLGCWLGHEALPSHWRRGMEHREWFEKKVDSFSETLGVTKCYTSLPYKGSEDPETRIDGGKGLLDDDALRARDLAFMDKYMRKTNIGLERERLRVEQDKKKGKKGWSGMFRSFAG